MEKNANPEKLLLTPTETAALLGISRSHFFALRAEGELDLPMVRIGRRTLYRREDVLAWVRALPTVAEESAGGSEGIHR